MTAVEWLQSKLKNVEYNPLEKNGYSNALERLYNQAKEMEKQQIQDAYRISPNNELWSNSGIDYYEKTFKNK